MNGNAADELGFSIEGIENSISELRASNDLNKRNKQAFLDYIDSTLSVEWNTTQGRVAVNELKNFVNGRFQEYVDYLDRRIDELENVVLPNIRDIDNIGG